MQYNISRDFEAMAAWDYLYKFDTPLEAMYTPGKPEFRIGSNEWHNELSRDLFDYFRHRRTTAIDTWRRIPDDCRGTSTEYPADFMREYGIDIARVSGTDDRTGNYIYSIYHFGDGESFCKCYGMPVTAFTLSEQLHLGQLQRLSEQHSRW